MCQGCGSCAAVCPNSASVLRGYRDQQLFEVIDAALAEMV
jgi:heterodisulfide reductase subunit A